MVAPRKGRKPKYKWDDWLEVGKVITLRKGFDYDCTTAAMVVQIRSAASKKGKSVRILVAEDERSLTFKVERLTREELASATD